MLVSQHYAGTGYIDLGVVDFPPRVIHPHYLDRAKRLYIKRDCRAGAIKDQIGRNTVVAVRDWLDCSGHVVLRLQWSLFETSKPSRRSGHDSICGSAAVLNHPTERVRFPRSASR